MMSVLSETIKLPKCKFIFIVIEMDYNLIYKLFRNLYCSQNMCYKTFHTFFSLKYLYDIRHNLKRGSNIKHYF